MEHAGGGQCDGCVEKPRLSWQLPLLNGEKMCDAQGGVGNRTDCLGRMTNWTNPAGSNTQRACGHGMSWRTGVPVYDSAFALGRAVNMRSRAGRG